MSARSMLARLRKIELSNMSHVLRVIGSVEAFEKEIADRVAAGTMCPHDGPITAHCVRSWVEHGHSEKVGNVRESWRGET